MSGSPFEMSSNGADHLSIETIQRLYDQSLQDSLERRRLARERRRREARVRLAVVLALLLTVVLVYAF